MSLNNRNCPLKVISVIVLLLLVLLSSTNVHAQETDIFAAVKQDDVAAIRSALDQDSSGTNLNQPGPGGQTPLVNAVLTGKLIAVQTLLEAKADVTIPEKDGYTVMHAAGFQGRAEILKVLVAFPDPNMQSMLHGQHADGYFPLHRACWGREPRHAATLQVFLDAGVEYDVEATNGKTCQDMTRNPDTLAVLKKAAAAKEGKFDEKKDTATKQEEEL